MARNFTKTIQHYHKTIQLGVNYCINYAKLRLFSWIHDKLEHAKWFGQFQDFVSLCTIFQRSISTSLFTSSQNSKSFPDYTVSGAYSEALMRESLFSIFRAYSTIVDRRIKLSRFWESELDSQLFCPIKSPTLVSQISTFCHGISGVRDFVR